MRPRCFRTPTASLTALALVFAYPAASQAQVDSTMLHATLSHWDQALWLQFLNREASDGGRMSSRGILQRFHETIDFEYQLDRLSAHFSFAEDYDWYRLRTNGVRWKGASITKRDLLIGTQFKTAIPIGRSWNFSLRFDQEINPTTDRHLLRFGFDKTWSSGVFAFARASLDALKPDSDIEGGVGWRSSNTINSRHEARLSAALVDWANNLIYLGLNAAEQPQVDSTLAYRGQSLAFRGSVSSRVSDAVRLEAFGAVAIPSTLDQYEGFEEHRGIRHDENFGYLGGLVEWSARSNLRLGGFATYVEARTERTALPEGMDVDEYRLVEKTTNVGVFGLYGMGRQWHLEALIAHNNRPETRDFRADTLPDVDYLDRAWVGRIVAHRTAARGLLADIGLMWDARDVVRGDGQVPSAGSLGRHNYRLTALVGWRFNEHVEFRLGAGLDLDGDHSGRNRFGGFRGRFTVVW